MRDATKPGTHYGFTLIELLVVIAVIAVLAALLFPVYASTKKSATRAVCQSNLRQIAEAFEAYLADYDGCYPNTGDPYLWMGRRWRWPMRKYLGFHAAYDSSDEAGAFQITGRTNTVLACPADPTEKEKWDRTSYGYSAAFYHTHDQIDSMTTEQLYSSPTPPCASVKSSSVRRPSKKAMVADWLTHSDERANWWSWNGSRNYLFADGHINYLNARKIKPSVTGLPDINLTDHGVAGTDVN